MRISRVGILVLIVFSVLMGAGCNSIIARKDLVDGAKAYKERKFNQAEDMFRDAVQRDPNQLTAQLFLARTLHSQYAANRQQVQKGEEAIVQYQKTIDEYKQAIAKNSAQLSGDQSPCRYSDYEISKMQGDKRTAFDAFRILGDSLKAVANLKENLGRGDERLQWLTQWGNDESLPACMRAEAFNSLAARDNTCANDISENPDIKKTVTKDGKQIYTFSKPAKPEEFEQFKKCVTEGSALINKAVELDSTSDSIMSYKTSLLIQSMRLAEMEGRTADRDNLKAEADQAKEKFTQLAKTKKEKSDSEEAAIKAAEAEKETK